MTIKNCRSDEVYNLCFEGITFQSEKIEVWWAVTKTGPAHVVIGKANPLCVFLINFCVTFLIFISFQWLTCYVAQIPVNEQYVPFLKTFVST